MHKQLQTHISHYSQSECTIDYIMIFYVLDRREAVSLNTAFHLAPSSKSHNLEQPESSDQG